MAGDPRLLFGSLQFSVPGRSEEIHPPRFGPERTLRTDHQPVKLLSGDGAHKALSPLSNRVRKVRLPPYEEA